MTKPHDLDISDLVSHDLRTHPETGNGLNCRFQASRMGNEFLETCQQAGARSTIVTLVDEHADCIVLK